jgi:hypothetical protein
MTYKRIITKTYGRNDASVRNEIHKYRSKWGRFIAATEKLVR